MPTMSPLVVDNQAIHQDCYHRADQFIFDRVAMKEYYDKILPAPGLQVPATLLRDWVHEGMPEMMRGFLYNIRYRHGASRYMSYNSDGPEWYGNPTIRHDDSAARKQIFPIPADGKDFWFEKIESVLFPVGDRPVGRRIILSKMLFAIDTGIARDKSSYEHRLAQLFWEIWYCLEELYPSARANVDDGNDEVKISNFIYNEMQSLAIVLNKTFIEEFILENEETHVFTAKALTAAFVGNVLSSPPSFFWYLRSVFQREECIKKNDRANLARLMHRIVRLNVFFCFFFAWHFQ